jgi:hypothetical protein
MASGCLARVFSVGNIRLMRAFEVLRCRSETASRLRLPDHRGEPMVASIHPKAMPVILIARCRRSKTCTLKTPNLPIGVSGSKPEGFGLSR